MSYLTEAADCITDTLQHLVDRFTGKTECPYCIGGKANYLGEVRFEEFMHDVNIMKTNGMYFLEVPNRHAERIVACPMCGRQFENDCQE